MLEASQEILVTGSSGCGRITSTEFVHGTSFLSWLLCFPIPSFSSCRVAALQTTESPMLTERLQTINVLHVVVQRATDLLGALVDETVECALYSHW